MSYAIAAYALTVLIWAVYLVALGARSRAAAARMKGSA